MALKRGAGWVFGIENADFAPESDAGKGHRLRNGRFAPGGAFEWGTEGLFGLKNTEIDPGRPSGEAFGLRNG